MERHLAVILAADIVGYSRQMRADEEGTLARLKAVRNELLAPKVREHNGCIVKLMGDGALVEFANAVDAPWPHAPIGPNRQRNRFVVEFSPSKIGYLVNLGLDDPPVGGWAISAGAFSTGAYTNRE